MRHKCVALCVFINSRCRYWVKCNLWIFIFGWVGNYFWTHYFYTVLRAKYAASNVFCIQFNS